MEMAFGTVVQGWPDESREAAGKTTDKYGEPDEVTPSQLVWHQAGPWKRLAVNRDPVAHRFPKPHHDMLEGRIDYRVPPERTGDLAAFDGSIRVERTRGELAARCDKEEMNFLALNLAHNLISGEVGVNEARRQYTEKAAKAMIGRSDPYTVGFVFKPPTGGTAEPDQPTIGEAAGEPMPGRM